MLAKLKVTYIFVHGETAVSVTISDKTNCTIIQMILHTPDNEVMPPQIKSSTKSMPT